MASDLTKAVAVVVLALMAEIASVVAAFASLVLFYCFSIVLREIAAFSIPSAHVKRHRHNAESK